MRLTAFEEYMLLDSHPAYPMSCFIELILKGDFDSAAFTEAADAAVRLHPLLSCSAEQTADGYHRWVPHEPAVCVIVSENTGTSSLPVSGGIDLFREVPLKITVCRLDAAVTQITMEVHHTACDAAGAFRFAEDVLYGYACRKGAADVSVQREAVKPELLPQRGKYGLTPSVWLRILPKQLWGLTRAWMFLFRRIRPLVPVQPQLDADKPAAAFPAVVSHYFDEHETQQIRRKAKDAGLTLNDAALTAAFLAMKQRVEKDTAQDLPGYLRIAVPTNLRTDADRLMPAANIVSMVFLDRKANRIADTPAFRQGIHQEMQHIKRCRLGLALIHGLRIYRRVFGSFTKMIRRDKCWTTATVSNIGIVFADLPLQKIDGRLQLGNSLELVSVCSVPPIRPQTVLGVCLLTYANRMTLCLHYDSAVLTRSEAEELLAAMSETIYGTAHNTP